MLQVQNLRKSYGAATVLADVTFLINDGERVGLIGPNGAGKSTILRCLAGQEQPDAGTIVLSPPRSVIGYLPQALAEPRDRTFGELVAAAQAELREAEQALAHAAEALGTAQDMDAALAGCYDQAGAAYICGAGCEIPRGTPHGNVEAMARFARSRS